MMVIGIDPDLEKCGVAVTRNGQVIELHALHLFKLMRFIDEYVAIGAEFILEDINENNAYHHKAGRDRGSLRKRDKINQNVGQAQATAKFVEDHLIEAGANYCKVLPLRGDLKKVKTDSALFQRYTGWPGKSNQDTRDAAMLALFGKRDRRLGDGAR